MEAVSKKRQILVIGMGAIGGYVAEHLASGNQRVRLAVIVRARQVEGVRADLAAKGIAAVTVVSRLDELDATPELAVECAGHAAVVEFGEACLLRGSDFLAVSVGAFTDAALRGRLEHAARTRGRQLLIPAGAIGGIDAIAAAREGGLDSVRYTSRKPPQAWKGSAAEQLVGLDSLDSSTEFFNGNAFEAARRFPQNANVAATLALAGLGFEQTEVSLNADPRVQGNVHVIEAHGAFGHLRIEVRGKPLPDNPKTSTLAALSVLRAIRNRTDAIQI